MERDDLTSDQAMIDAALQSMPLEPLPEGFVATTMRRVVAAPRFRIQFLDVAIPFSVAALVCSLVISLLWLAGLFSAVWLPPPPSTLPFGEVLMAIPWLGVGVLLVAVEAGLALVAIACVALWLDRPGWISF